MALLCLCTGAFADGATTGPEDVVACLSAVDTQDASFRGELRDACVQDARALCKAMASDGRANCYTEMARGMAFFAERIVAILPDNVTAEEDVRLSYLRNYKTLTAEAWSPQGCMVPSIATVSGEVRRSLCDVQHSYSRLKLALSAARIAGAALP